MVATMRHYLAPLFEPGSVAVIGATESPGKVGDGIVSNMLAARFSGQLFAVNPKYRSVKGVPCFPDLAALPDKPELAVIATPPQTVPGLIRDCGRVGVGYAVVITAGFSEVGTAGAKLERETLEAARLHRVRIIGPNCLGILRPSIGLNASFARGGARPGSVALLSQSGAVCTAMLDSASVTGLGFSTVISLGGSADVGFAESLDYLAADPATRHILMYVEGVRDARRFLSSLRAAARDKNVVLMKVGRHAAGSRAAVSHTGAIVGADDVFDAALARTAALRVQTFEELATLGEVLGGARNHHADSKRGALAIITNGGGPGVMAADTAEDMGVRLAELSDSTVASLKSALPANWSHGNPLDLIGDADAERYRAALAACLADPGVDGALVILTPQSLTDPTAIAAIVVAEAEKAIKPLLACWMGGSSILAGRDLMRSAGICVFEGPEAAVRAWRDLCALPRLREAQWRFPPPLPHDSPPAADVMAGRAIVDAALNGRNGDRTILGTRESLALLRAFRIPVVESWTATTADEAANAACTAGFPAVMKIRAVGITHKSDAGGVRLGLSNVDAVRAAYRDMIAAVNKRRPEAAVEGVDIQPMLVGGHELLVGVLRDRVFGPAITFGAGGVAVELLRDRSIALPPLDRLSARDLVDSTRVSKLLKGFRGAPPANREAVESVLLRISEMVCALPELAELDINPLIVNEQRAVALDARIVLTSPGPLLGPNPHGHLAVAPWPAHLCETALLKNGKEVEIRPMRPEDTAVERQFVENLSVRSRRLRFMAPIAELPPAMLARFTHPDYDRDMAFIAIQHVPDEGEVEIGVARYCLLPDGMSCEFAIAVADAWQGLGLGTLLMRKLIGVARTRGLEHMQGEMLAENLPVIELCRRLGFRISSSGRDMCAAGLDLHRIEALFQLEESPGRRL